MLANNHYLLPSAVTAATITTSHITPSITTTTDTYKYKDY